MMEKPKLYWQRIWGLPSAVAQKNQNGHYMSGEHLDKVMGEWYEKGATDGHDAAFREGVEFVGKRIREEEARYGWELNENEPGFYIVYQVLRDLNAIKERPPKEAEDDPQQREA